MTTRRRTLATTRPIANITTAEIHCGAIPVAAPVNTAVIPSTAPAIPPTFARATEPTPIPATATPVSSEPGDAGAAARQREELAAAEHELAPVAPGRQAPGELAGELVEVVVGQRVDVHTGRLDSDLL